LLEANLPPDPQLAPEELTSTKAFSVQLTPVPARDEVSFTASTEHRADDPDRIGKV
jgi:hypothetical protein